MRLADVRPPSLQENVTQLILQFCDEPPRIRPQVAELDDFIGTGDTHYVRVANEQPQVFLQA